MPSVAVTRNARIRTRTPRAARWLALGVLTAWLTSPQPCSAQAWEPSSTQKARLLELATTFNQWLSDHQPAVYQRILDREDPRSRLLDEPGVMLAYIDDRGQPVWFETTNLNAARTISTDEVWPGGGSGYGLDGAGTAAAALGIWEAGGAVRVSHQEFGGRITQIDGGTLSDHATHVAGTMLAAGMDAAAQGMSFAASMNAYDAAGDTGEMTAAAAAGLLISNHSYGRICGWRVDDGNWYGDTSIDQNEDWKFGFYNAQAQQWDQLAVAAPNYLIFKSAGNDRNDFAPPPGTAHMHGSDGATFTDTHDSDGDPLGYDTIPTYGTAKNIMTVGAVDDIPGGYTGAGDVVQSAFSGWGPADDGRIKPDIVANGVSLYSTGADSDTDYYTTSGTSMSTPNASGSANLLREQFQDLNGVLPRSATLKALIIHTADEAGPADGPDYMNGWGLMNTESAADVIAAGQFDDRGIVEDDLADTATDSWTLNVNSVGDARVTIVWTDPAGTPPADALDPTDVMLVNDLDLRITHVDSGTTYRPWVLNPASPANAATTGDNVLDNVEQVHIANAALGQYTISVTHKGSLVDAPQQYSLIYSGMSRNAAPVAMCQDVTVPADDACLAEVAPEDVDDGSFDPDGDPITLSLSPEGPYGLGETEVTLTVSDDKGASGTCTATITVEDETPPVVECPPDVVVECSVAGGVPIDDPQLTDFFDGFSASDNCDSDLTIVDNAPPLFEGPCSASGGVTVVTWTATDDAGNSSQCSATVTVVDTVAPTFDVLLPSRDVLWPPNHKMVDISMEIEVSDVCDDDVIVTLDSITSSEPDDGQGDGSTEDDIQDATYGTDDRAFALRAERSGLSDEGRTYTITYTVADCSGNSTTESVEVLVPHDQGAAVARGVSGLSEDGTTVDETAAFVSFVIPSIPFENPPAETVPGGARLIDRLAFDATRVLAARARLGNTAGVAAPVRTALVDIDGDHNEDLLIVFDATHVGALAQTTTEHGSVGLQFRMRDTGQDFLVTDVFQLGAPVGGALSQFIRSSDEPTEEIPQNVESAPANERLRISPNPFNPHTAIAFDLARPDDVRLCVYNPRGERVATLVDGSLAAGRYEISWTGRDDRGAQVVSGFYIVRLQVGSVVQTAKIALLK